MFHFRRNIQPVASLLYIQGVSVSSYIILMAIHKQQINMHFSGKVSITICLHFRHIVRFPAENFVIISVLPTLLHVILFSSDLLRDGFEGRHVPRLRVGPQVIRVSVLKYLARQLCAFGVQPQGPPCTRRIRRTAYVKGFLGSKATSKDKSICKPRRSNARMFHLCFISNNALSLLVLSGGGTACLKLITTIWTNRTHF